MQSRSPDDLLAASAATVVGRAGSPLAIDVAPNGSEQSGWMQSWVSRTPRGAAKGGWSELLPISGITSLRT